jgi:hypothetical protein
MTDDKKRAEYREHAKALREIAADKAMELDERDRAVLLNLALGYEALADGKGPKRSAPGG